MKPIKTLLRLSQINHILAKNGLDQVIVSIRLFAPLRFIVWFNPWNWVRNRGQTRGEALRRSFEALGPVFVKFGQALSTRPDILPPDIAMELSRLQDRVPPFPGERALEIIHEAYGKSAESLFATFDPVPLASASMAQVHAATFTDGREVVVKVLRPNMRRLIERDIDVLYTLATLAERYWPLAKRLKPREIVREFEINLLDELDLQREAANASQLRRNFEGSEKLYVPEVYWDYVRDNVLVQERIYGIPVSDIASLKAHGIDIKRLAERGVDIFFTQVFRDSFFHADMHPGNIFVSPEHPANPQYMCVDFGIMGTLTDSDQRYLAENLFAFFNRDYRRVAQLHVESGWVSRDTRVGDFESAIRTVCEPVFEKPLRDISFAQLMMRLFQVARRFHMEVQPQLVLLQKTLLAIEGLGRQLYPDLDLWTTAKPFLEKWLKAQVGPRAFVKRLRENIPFLTEQLPGMPRLLNDVLVLAKEEKIEALQAIARVSESSKVPARRGGLGLGICITAIGALALHAVKLPPELPVVWIWSAVAAAGALTALIAQKTGR